MLDSNLILLKTSIPWFFYGKEPEKVKILGYELPHVDDAFLFAFPKLSTLIKASKVVNFSIDQSLYTFFFWIDQNGNSCGLLNEKIEDSNPTRIIKEHAVLTSVIGGVVEYFSDFDKGVFANYNFLFGQNKCAPFNDSHLYPYYIEACKRLQIRPIATEKFIIFGEEANANKVMYESESKAVFLYAQDHSFGNSIKPVQGQPEYTFYEIEGVKTFTDYVEKFAQMWLEKIGTPRYIAP